MNLDYLNVFGIKDVRVSKVLGNLAEAVIRGRAKESLTILLGIKLEHSKDILGAINLGEGIYFHPGRGLSELVGGNRDSPAILMMGDRIKAEEKVHKLLNREAYRRASGIREGEQVDSLNFLGFSSDGRFYPTHS